ncbi:MAG: SRPBCC family protein [Chitinophagales bacterium]|nr:SRPBCC family protein [Chitinophagales bacterium]
MITSLITQYTQKETIHLLQDFEVPVEIVFNFFSEHENMGKIYPAAVKRIKFGEDPRDANSKGSVRRIIAFPLIIEETITQYVPNQLIEYKITNGFGIKDHLGTMNFSRLSDNQCRLDYRIDVTPSLPMTGFFIKNTLEKIIGRGVRESARQLKINPRF